MKKSSYFSSQPFYPNIKLIISEVIKQFSKLFGHDLMANFSIIKCIPKCIAVKKKNRSIVTSKIYKTVGSIGFIKKALYHEVTPKFAQVKAILLRKTINIVYKKKYTFITFK